MSPFKSLSRSLSGSKSLFWLYVARENYCFVPWWSTQAWQIHIVTNTILYVKVSESSSQLWSVTAPPQKKLAQEGLLVCLHAVSSAVHDEEEVWAHQLRLATHELPVTWRCQWGALAHMRFEPIHCSTAGRKLEEAVSIFLCYPCDLFHKSCPSQIAA